MNRFVLTTALSVALCACGPGKTMSSGIVPLAKFKSVQSAVRPQVFSLDATESSITVGTLKTWRWLFGDETGGAAATDLTTAITQHEFSSTGSFTITLVVIDSSGVESEPVSQTVTVNAVNTEGPKARIASATSGMPNMAIAFDGSASTPSGDLVEYAWAFGDGTTEKGATKTGVSHAFAAGGVFTVTLTVTDSSGQTDTAEQAVTIATVGPVALCTWSPMPATQGSPVGFDASGSTAPMGSTISVYVWDFGDGVNNVPGVMASHTYNTQATFKPKLKVIDSLNRVGEAACPDVVVGAASVCAGRYSMTSTGSSGSGCIGTFSGNQLTLAEMTDGSVTGSEPGPNSSTIPYAGTWTGSVFTMSGTFNDGLFDHTITITGTLSGCGSYSGTYNENVSGLMCTYQINGTKL